MASIYSRAAVLLATGVMVLMAEPGQGKSIIDSVHNLSMSGPGAVKATAQSEICIFCHTPHNARPDAYYLWNRLDPAGPYTPYCSTTLKATVGQPTGTSRLCLSCHDGTIAAGAVLSRTAVMPFTMTLSGRNANLGTNLADDHPVSFSYSAAVLLSNSQLVSAASLPTKVRLDSTGQMQCTACHNPHDDQYGKFLVISNLKSGLCTACHSKTNWSINSHATSTKTWNGTGTDPWPSSDYTTVADNACGNCHRPHSAPGQKRLLNYATEETNCLVCHNGNVALKNISSELTKTYKHPVTSYAGVHDPAEKYSGLVPNHVECSDCHNPHQVNSSNPGAPLVPGRLAGVPGVDLYTNAYIASSVYEYQVCFKCHGDLSNNVLRNIAIEIPRYWTNTRDNRVKFTGVSYHPIVQSLNKISDNLLIFPWVKGSKVYCTDCHGSDSSTIKGSHGSIYEHILVAKYETSPSISAGYVPSDYALCFKCHNYSTLTGSSSKFPQHQKHFNAGERCTYCHDPHGSPTNAGMINFDMRPGIVRENGKPIVLKYPLSSKNTCVLICHSKVHGS